MRTAKFRTKAGNTLLVDVELLNLTNHAEISRIEFVCILCFWLTQCLSLSYASELLMAWGCVQLGTRNKRATTVCGPTWIKSRNKDGWVELWSIFPISTTRKHFEEFSSCNIIRYTGAQTVWHFINKYSDVAATAALLFIGRNTLHLPHPNQWCHRRCFLSAVNGETPGLTSPIGALPEVQHASKFTPTEEISVAFYLLYVVASRLRQSWKRVCVCLFY